MTSLEPVGDRRKLEYEISAVRLLAIIDFSLILITLAVVAFFFGFDSGIEQLFLLSLLHILLAPLAGYASLRLGVFLTAALAVVALVFLLDVIQWFIRVFAFPFTLLGFIFLVVNTVFIIIDILYALAVWRLRVTDEAQNNAAVDFDREERHRAVIRQEANTVRLTGLFGIVTIVLLALFVLVFFSFTDQETELLLFSVPHVLVAPYALVLAPRGTVWMTVLLSLAVILLVLDSIQFVWRFLLITQGQLIALTLANFFAVLFALINIGFLLIDLMYIIGSAGYIYEKTTYIDDDGSDTTTPTGTHLAVESDASAAYKIRRRKKRYD